MNWIRKQFALLLILIAAVALNAFGVWRLLRAIEAKNTAQLQYRLKSEERKNLTTAPSGPRATPWLFPSPENRGLLAENEKILRELAAAMSQQLQGNAQEFKPMEQTEFQAHARTIVTRLHEQAKRAGTATPEGFYFGFHYYYHGMLPFKGNTPRLQQQLAAVEALTGILFECRVPRLENLLVIEPPGEAALKQTSGIDPPQIPEILPDMTIVRRNETGFVYELIPFKLTIQCPTETLKAVLNRFASDPRFFIVTRLDPLLSVRTDQQSEVPVTEKLPPTSFVYGEQQVRATITLYVRGFPPIADTQPQPDANPPPL